MNKLYESIVLDEKVQQMLELNWKGAVATGMTAAALALSLPQNAEAKPPVKMEQTLGHKNNNPINLKAFENWRGMVGKDKQGHAIFNSLEYGIRAGLKNLKNHFSKHPDQTLVDYLNTFAEKNGTHEANFIAKELNISPSSRLKDLDFTDVFVSLSKIESKTKLDKQEVLKIKEKYHL